MGHKKTFTSFLVLSVVTLLVAFATGCGNNSQAQANRIVFTNEFSGSFHETSIDTNEDEDAALVVNIKGSLGSLGPVTFQYFIEGDPSGPVLECTTPNGLPGVLINLLEAAAVYRLDNTGELIYTRSTSGAACFPVTPEDISFGFTAEDVLIGGTGRFENATGSIDTDGGGDSLVGMGLFGGVSGVQTGEIVIE